MKTCPHCGAQMNDSAMFCTNCGKAADAAPEQPNYNQDPIENQPVNADGSSQYQYQGADPNQQYQQYDQYQQYGQQQYQQYQYQQPVPPVMPYDHTSEFTPEDISSNKVYCMLGYISGFVGIIIALLASGADRSPYINFHIRQAIKFSIINTLTNIVMAVLCFTIIIPIAGAIWKIILLVLKIIAFVQVCMGQAKEPAIIRAFPFLK